ncbi:MAG: efflux RND transporter periplasmic adaptor subunit [Salinivirgaceae bacterium]|jgi:membrane fusion protein (multidrug efflux system)|nr:efflux RND transporter periplasmic adaptor subunit [Salinivirgaceae bacterium]
MTKTLFIFSIFLLSLLACKPKDQKPDEVDKSAYLEDKNPVEVMVLQPTTFTRQLVSNGKLAALRKSELKFRISEEIASIKVNNGQRVKQGSILAKLNKTEFQQKVQQAQTALEKASGEAFCTLIDDSQFEVSFQVLETELSEIQLNMGVKVVPFSLEDKVFMGKVS